MPWHLTVHNEHHFLEICYSGDVTAEELLESFQTTLACTIEQQTYLLLADCSKLRGGHSSADLKVLADALATSKIDFTFKEAVLVPVNRDASSRAYFWSFLTQNTGFEVKPFESRQHALAWLLASDT